MSQSILSTLVTLHSFLENNSWFNGKVYVITPVAPSISEKSLSDLTLIYQNIEIIDCSIDPTFKAVLDSALNDPTKVQQILLAKSLFLNCEKLLTISSSCLFLKDVSHILKPNHVVMHTLLSDSTPHFFYLGKKLEHPEDLLSVFQEKEPLIRLLEFNSVTSNSQILGDISFNYKDVNHIKNRNIIKSLHFIKYQDLKKDIRNFTRINQLWLQQQNTVVNLLKRPSFRGGRTLIKSSPPKNLDKFKSIQTPLPSSHLPVTKKYDYPNSQSISRSSNNIVNNSRLISIKDIANLFSNKKICLVANSSDLLDVKLGEFIDSHDCVIRFNSFKIDPEYTGTKTTIHSSIYLENENLDELVDYRLIISINKKNWIDRVNSLDSTKQKSVIDLNWPISNFSNTTQFRSNRVPTTGFNTMLMFYNHVQYSTLSLIGFNFYKNGKNSIYRKDHISSDIAKIHNYSFEENWIKRIFLQKNNIFIHEKSNSL